jgi:hypothetical protein
MKIKPQSNYQSLLQGSITEAKFLDEANLGKVDWRAIIGNPKTRDDGNRLLAVNNLRNQKKSS